MAHTLLDIDETVNSLNLKKSEFLELCSDPLGPTVTHINGVPHFAEVHIAAWLEAHTIPARTMTEEEQDRLSKEFWEARAEYARDMATSLG